MRDLTGGTAVANSVIAAILANLSGLPESAADDAVLRADHAVIEVLETGSR